MEAETSGLKLPRNREGKEFLQQERRIGPEGVGIFIKMQGRRVSIAVSITVSMAGLLLPKSPAASCFLGNAPFIPFPFPLCLLPPPQTK